MTSLYRYYLVGLFSFIISITQSNAQVSTTDSLALVDLYTSTAGNTWNSHTNWLSGNVSTWAGITVASNRVTQINLSANNLSGTLPASFCDLTQLKYLYLSSNTLSGALPTCFGNLTQLNTIDLRNNNFSGAIPSSLSNFTQLADLLISNNKFDQLPDLTSLAEFSNLLVQDNRFTFEDLLPNVSILNFQYIPQDSLSIGVDTLVTIFDTISFSIALSGTGNVYQWKKQGMVLNDATPFTGTQTNFFTIQKINLKDTGQYTCVISNPSLPGLFITRRMIHVRVNDNRLLQSLFFNTGNDFYCGDEPVKITAVLSSALPFSYEIVSGNALMKSDTLIPYSPGNVTIRAFHDGDDVYQPIKKDTTIAILTPNENYPITRTIPEDESQGLELSVPFFNAIDYQWITPMHDTVYHNVYSKSPVSEADIGNYSIRIGKNNCYYFSETIVLDFTFLRGLIAYELISPNSDGKNDYFYVQNIEKYSDSEVQIFNAWSQLVYEKNNYTNDWSGENLPGGTYYYLIKIPSQEKILKGSVYLKK